MNRKVWIVGALVVSLAGCGGGGGGGGKSSGGGGGGGANSLTGTYFGDFIDQNKTIGTFKIVVTSNGSISGTLGYATPISFTGAINSSGQGSLKDSNGTFPFSITTVASGTDAIGGGFGTSKNGAFFTAATTNDNGMTPGAPDDYTGWYGTAVDTTTNTTTIISTYNYFNESGFTTGVEGVELVSVNGTPTMVTFNNVNGITPNLSGNGSTLQVTINNVTYTGAFPGGASPMTINMTGSNGDKVTVTLTQLPTTD